MAWSDFLAALGGGIETVGNDLERKRQLAIDEEERQRRHRLEDEDRARQAKLLDLSLAEAAVNAGTPNQEVDPQTAALIDRTPFRIRLRKQQTLPSRTFGDVSGNNAPTSSITLRPTEAQQNEMTQQRWAQQAHERELAMQKRQDELAAKYRGSDDPILRAFGEAVGAGVGEVPLPFSEQLNQARQLGEVQNRFAIERINAQIQRYAGDDDRKRQSFVSVMRAMLPSDALDQDALFSDPNKFNEFLSRVRQVTDFVETNGGMPTSQTPPPGGPRIGPAQSGTALPPGGSSRYQVTIK